LFLRLVKVTSPGAVVQRGGRILCVQASVAATACDSAAFANKLIAMVVPDAVYEKYLQVSVIAAHVARLNVPRFEICIAIGIAAS
jgi:hypothetical protein